MNRLASTDLERSREWIARAATGLWGSFVRAADCHNAGDEKGEAMPGNAPPSTTSRSPWRCCATATR